MQHQRDQQQLAMQNARQLQHQTNKLPPARTGGASRQYVNDTAQITLLVWTRSGEEERAVFVNVHILYLAVAKLSP